MANKRWTADDVGAWFASRVPNGWFIGHPELQIDREEILVVGELSAPSVSSRGRVDDGGLARLARIEDFRERTRDRRMAIAADAEVLWGRKVSWGARCGDVDVVFSTVSVPVMTRLRMEERAVLDTLIDAGVARSRSEALAWCVRLVQRNQEPWIEQLRTAVATVEQARAEGPDLS
jgi:hypothetical protein